MLANLFNKEPEIIYSISERQKYDCNKPEFIEPDLEGCIHHAAHFPLECRSLSRAEYHNVIDQGTGTVGLSFFSDNKLDVGSYVEILIPTPKKAARFVCKVICLRAVDERYQIGLWFLSHSDSHKIRMVEQVCHIELYVNERRFQEGPFLSKEKLTQEWVERFAAQFPSMA